MTTPPPPPPDTGDWPPSQPDQPDQPSQPPKPNRPPQPSQPWPPSQRPSPGDGREKWWTGGRILVAIVIVLVLMGVSAVGGFIAGSTWGTIDTFAGGFDTDGDGFSFDGDVPGFVSVDAPATEGEAVQPGSRVNGTVDRPVEHALTLASSREVVLEITDADFDTVLVVLDAAGEVVEADDDGGDSTNSAMQLTLSAGTYQVRVQPWGEGAGGNYTLAVD